MKRNFFKQVMRIVIWGVSFLLAVLIIFLFLLKIPSIQNRIADHLATSLSERVGAEISIESVGIRFFKSATLEGLIILDQEQDTIVWLNYLEIDIGVFALFDQEIYLDEINLDGGRINLYRSKSDSTYNYQFLLDAFAGNPEDTSKSSWALGAGKIRLQDLAFTQSDSFYQRYTSATIGTVIVYADSIDMADRLIAVRQIGIGESAFIYRDEGTSELTMSDTLQEKNVLSFPGIDWDIRLNQMRIDQSDFIYEVAASPLDSQHVDFNHLQLNDLHLALDHLYWSDDRLDLEITGATFADRSGFALNDLAASVYMLPELIHVTDFYLKTPHSEVFATTALDFDHFSQLADFTDSVYLTSYFDESLISFVDLDYLIPALREQPYIRTDLRHPIFLDGMIKGTISDLSVEVLQIRIPGLFALNAEGKVRGLPYQMPEFNLRLKELSSSYTSLSTLTQDIALPEGIQPWGDFALRGQFEGNPYAFSGRGVRLSTESVTGFRGDFDLKGLRDMKSAVFDLRIDELRSVATDLDGFMEGGIPSQLDSLGEFFFTGSFLGTIYDFDVNGQLVSDAGIVRTKLEMAFTDDWQDATYRGDISTDTFNLGKVLGSDQFGRLSMDVYSYGQGLDDHNLKTVVMGDIKLLDFLGYQYRDLSLDGRFDKRQFSGHAAIDDENINFDFEGVVSLDDTLAKFRFRSRVDTIDFRALNLLETELAMSARIRSDFRGESYLGMKGDVMVTDLVLSNLDHTYQTDSVFIQSDQESQQQKEILIRSEFLNGYIRGEYSLQDLPTLIRSYVDGYFPINEYVDTTAQSEVEELASSPDIHPADQHFEFDFTLARAQPLLSLVLLDLERLDALELQGGLDTRQDQLKINGHLAGLKYGGINLGPMIYHAEGDPGSLDQTLRLSEISLPGNIYYPGLLADLTFQQDTAYVGLSLQDDRDTLQEKVGLAASVTRDRQSYLMELNRDFTLNGSLWEVDPRHRILWHSGQMNISDLNLRRDDQLLSVKTQQEDTDDWTLALDFEHFKLEELTTLLNQYDAAYAGQIEGNVSLKNSDGRLRYLADLELMDITLNNEPVGNLVVRSQQRTNDLIDVMVKLEGGISGLDVRGTYNTLNNALNIQGEVDRLELESLDPLLKGYIRDSEGTISGIVDIQGTLDVPQINGSVEMDELSTVIEYLQGRYTLKNESLDIRQNTIYFDGFTLTDPEGNEAVASGAAEIGDFGSLDFDLDFSTNKFLVLNTSLRDNNLFFGKIWVAADVGIGGTSDQPTLSLNARTLSGTDFTVQPLTYEESFQQEDFIIFANPETYSEGDTTIDISTLYQLSNYGISIDANFELTPDAQLTIVVDPATGDKLVCRGTANLTVDVDKLGNLDVLGNYTIDQGEYAFNFQRVLRRTFTIEPGSTVTFIGDPLKSRFDIAALYDVKTTTYELIRNQSTLSSVEETRSKQRREVQVQLNLAGNLEQPRASFDILIPEGSGSALTSSVSSKLAQLREDESSMNKQVFGLLIFNSFLAEEQSTGASNLIADASQSVLLSSVSNLLTNELNRLAQRYIKGVDLDFGVGSYSSRFGEEEALITELQVGLSKSLLNDRLSVKLGGNVQFDNNPDVDLNNNNQNSTFSGDFVLEYKLTPQGNYRLRFFQILSNEENIFNPGVNYSETGVSVFFTKSFNSKKYRAQLEESVPE